MKTRSVIGEVKHIVGWHSLLSPWQTEKGTNERKFVLGIELDQKHTLEEAKITKKLFDEYQDEKWRKLVD